MEEQDLTQQRSQDQRDLNNQAKTTARGAALKIGSRVGNFEIEQVLGIGGFGIVYRAIQHTTGRHVAIKEFFPSSMLDRVDSYAVKLRSDDDESLFMMGMRSFVNEATILSGLNHPGLVQVLHFWEENGTAYMAMPYYEGITLSRHLAQLHAAASVELLQNLVTGLLPTLEYLHERQIFHRDISPDNIVLLTNGQPLLLDFGAARHIVDTSDNVTVILKSGYAPIEQYDQTGEQGSWTDIYALSALLYKVVTGHAPQASVTRVYNDTLEALESSYSHLYPAGILRAIDAGLAVRPEQRPATIAAWRRIANSSEPLAARSLPEQALILSRTPVASPKFRAIWVFIIPMALVGAVLYLVQPDNYQRMVGVQVQKLYQQLDKQLADQQQVQRNAAEQVALLQTQLAAAQDKPQAGQLRQSLLEAQEVENIASSHYQVLKAKYDIELANIKNTLQQADLARNQDKTDDASAMYTLAQQQLQALDAWHRDYGSSLIRDRLALIQKLNGVWAPKSCQRDLSTLGLDGQLLHIKQNDVASTEKIVAAYAGKVFTMPVLAAGAPVTDQFVEYQFNKAKLEVRKDKIKQVFISCVPN